MPILLTCLARSSVLRIPLAAGFRPSTGRRAALCGLLLSAGAAAVAQPAAVSPGLWEVHLLTTAERTPAALSVTPMPAPQRRIYRICITPERAAAPVTPPLGVRRLELLYDRDRISGNWIEMGPDRRPRAVEFGYHRVDATRFEGSHDAEGPQLVLRTQYSAQHVAAECGPRTQPGQGSPAEP